MIGLIFNDKFIKKLGENLSSKLTERFTKQDEVLDQIVLKLNDIDQKVSELDLRLTKKELKDKTEYGQLVYKVNALKSELRPRKPLKEKNSH